MCSKGAKLQVKAVNAYLQSTDWVTFVQHIPTHYQVSLSNHPLQMNLRPRENERRVSESTWPSSCCSTRLYQRNQISTTTVHPIQRFQFWMWLWNDLKDFSLVLHTTETQIYTWQHDRAHFPQVDIRLEGQSTSEATEYDRTRTPCVHNGIESQNGICYVLNAKVIWELDVFIIDEEYDGLVSSIVLE